MYIINGMECPNTLDEKSSTWKYYSDGTRGPLKEYAFFKDRITESSLFKIPQTSKAEILTYAGLKDPEDEFMPLYKQLGFTGLVFEKLG